MTRILPVISGSRKVGKTTICANMAYHLSEQGLRTCILSFDLKSGQSAPLLSVHSDHDLAAVFDGDKTIEEILVRTDFGVDIIPANMGRDLSEDTILEKMSKLNLYMGSVMDPYDVLLLDTPSGITRQAVACALASPEIIMVLTPDSKALSRAYDFLKILTRNGFNERVSVVVNRSQGDRKSHEAFQKLKEPAGKYLNLTLTDTYDIPLDPKVSDAERQHRILGKAVPDAPALKGIYHVADQIVKTDNPEGNAVGAGLFWEQLSMIAQFPLDFSGVNDDQPMIIEDSPVAAPSAGDDAAESLPIEAPPPASPEDRGADMSPMPEPAPLPEYQHHQASHQTVVTGGTVSLPGMDRILDRLAQGIESISHELAALRKMMENRSPQVASGSGTGKPVERVTLDFESYRAARESGSKTKKA